MIGQWNNSLKLALKIKERNGKVIRWRNRVGTHSHQLGCSHSRTSCSLLFLSLEDFFAALHNVPHRQLPFPFGQSPRTHEWSALRRHWSPSIFEKMNSKYACVHEQPRRPPSRDLLTFAQDTPFDAERGSYERVRSTPSGARQVCGRRRSSQSTQWEAPTHLGLPSTLCLSSPQKAAQIKH